MSTCAINPNKKVYTDLRGAVRAAEERSAATGLNIKPAPCEKHWHMAEDKDGTLTLLTEVEIEKLIDKVIPGDRPSRIKAIKRYLHVHNPNPTTKEIADICGFSRNSTESVRSLMNELGYVVTKGKGAVWMKDERVKLAPVTDLPAAPSIEESMARHPSSNAKMFNEMQDIKAEVLGKVWKDIPDIADVERMTILEFTEFCSMVGLDVRIQTKYK